MHLYLFIAGVLLPVLAAAALLVTHNPRCCDKVNAAISQLQKLTLSAIRCLSRRARATLDLCRSWLVRVYNCCYPFFCRIERLGLLPHRSLPSTLASSSARPSCRCTESSALPNPEHFTCRIQLDEPKATDHADRRILVQIAGPLQSSCPEDHVILQISILDLTDESCGPYPVLSANSRYDPNRPETPCYRSDLGKVPQQRITLADWITVATICTRELRFPFKGRRHLRFDISILSAQTGQTLASAESELLYDNPNLGYIDEQRNIEHAHSLAVALALAVSAADGRMLRCEIEVVRHWVELHFLSKLPNRWLRQKLRWNLERSISFFRQGNLLDLGRICRDIAASVEPACRYDIFRLCLDVAAAKGFASLQQLQLLGDLSRWLELDTERCYAMIESLLPPNPDQLDDAETILGLTPDMTDQQRRQHLNRQYAKWNARVTSSDPHIRKQADQMLKLIARTRSQYAEHPTP